MANTIIYHNPKCGTSRNVLALIQQHEEPTIIEYLKTPLSKEELSALVAKLGVPVRDILRSKEAIYSELKLDEHHWTDDELIEAMVKHPILMNRPIVVTPKGAKLCRPSETVSEIL